MRWARYEQMHVVLADVPLDDLNLELRADIRTICRRRTPTSACSNFLRYFVIHTKWYSGQIVCATFSDSAPSPQRTESGRLKARDFRSHNWDIKTEFSRSQSLKGVRR